MLLYWTHIKLSLLGKIRYQSMDITKIQIKIWMTLSYKQWKDPQKDCRYILKRMAYDNKLYISALRKPLSIVRTHLWTHCKNDVAITECLRVARDNGLHGNGESRRAEGIWGDYQKCYQGCYEGIKRTGRLVHFIFL